MEKLEKKVNIIINKQPFAVSEGVTIIEAARQAGYDIPSLCYLKGCNNTGSCRVCVVEVKGARALVTSCNTPVSEGMDITTFNSRVQNARKTTLELLLSNHDQKCTSCPRNLRCELQKLAEEYGCKPNAYAGRTSKSEIDDSSEFLVRDNSKCVLCRRCTAVCSGVQGVGIISPTKRGFATNITSAFDDKIAATKCVSCGQCINVCPVAALREKSSINEVFSALNDKTKTVIAVTAPAVRATIGEEFDNPMGVNTEGKMVTALKRLGFSKVFDVVMTADLTIMEEGTELLERIKEGKNLPLITSCSPGWIRYAENFHPAIIDNISTCKSPQQMMGAVIKTYYAQKEGIDPNNIVVVSVMPCTAKKYERTRKHQQAAGVNDVDVVITTRELAQMINQAGIMYNSLPNGEFDNPLGEGSGAGLIFGNSGGVTEAAVRTLAELTGSKGTPKFAKIRGTAGVKEATFDLGGKNVNVAVVSGLKNAKRIVEQIEKGESKYQFIEIMACPGGCINGGGQPIVSSKIRNNTDYVKVRMKALYTADSKMKLNKSHENPVVKELYGSFFGKPGSEKAHHILHTSYEK